MQSGYFDLTCRFLQYLSRGNQYFMVDYHYDVNSILSIPMKNRAAASMVNTMKELYNKYKLDGVIPNTYVLDNETSDDFKEAFKHTDIKFQLVLLHNHRNNVAERVIQTFKYHIKQY